MSNLNPAWIRTNILHLHVFSSVYVCACIHMCACIHINAESSIHPHKFIMWLCVHICVFACVHEPLQSHYVYDAPLKEHTRPTHRLKIEGLMKIYMLRGKIRFEKKNCPGKLRFAIQKDNFTVIVRAHECDYKGWWVWLWGLMSVIIRGF